jgi:hypothetical protein
VAFSKAIREVKRLSTGYLIRPVKETESEVVTAIVAEDADTKTDVLKYDQELTIRFLKQSNKIKTSNDDHPIAHIVTDTFAAMQKIYVVNDFVRLLTRNVRQKMLGIVVRPTGGIYFVPQGPAIEELYKHAAVFAELGEAELTVIPMHNDLQTSRSIAAKSRKALEVELKEIEDELKKFKSVEPRRDTLERRIPQFRDLKKKAQFFADMLAIKIDDIHSSLDIAERTVTELLGGISSKQEEQKEKRKEQKRSYARRWKRRINLKKKFGEGVGDEVSILRKVTRVREIVPQKKRRRR